MRKPHKRDNEISYWESMADGVVGLLLCVLLILMLLILYLIRANDYEYVEEYDEGHENGTGYSWEQEYTDPGGGWVGDGDEEDDEEDGGGGGYAYEDPDPGMGEGDGSDKAAVLVQVIDGETEKIIRKSGIEFELYNSSSTLETLSTYYPIKTEYKKYETDQNGMFYLPEKVRLGTYYLNQLTEIEGYDSADNWDFTPDDDYDWDAPYLVSVAVYPSKNIVRIQLRDDVSGEPLNGASFDIVAAEDIITKDGTTRYKQGDVADTVEINEKGYAESKELYLGKYLIRQKTAPEYYSCLLSDTGVEVKSKSQAATPVLNELSERKTAVNIKVTDALYDNQSIKGAAFKITTDNGDFVGTLTSDDNGSMVLENLKKGQTYHVQQTTTAANYKMDANDYAFTVDSRGLINEKEVEELHINNGIVRVSFAVKDKLFNNRLSDITVALIDDSGKVVQKWSSTAVENMIEGLAPGEYRIVLDGNEEDAYPVIVEDVIDIQSYEFAKWTVADIGCIAAIGIISAGIIALLVFLFGRRKRKGKSEKE